MNPRRKAALGLAAALVLAILVPTLALAQASPPISTGGSHVIVVLAPTDANPTTSGATSASAPMSWGIEFTRPLWSSWAGRFNWVQAPNRTGIRGTATALRERRAVTR